MAVSTCTWPFELSGHLFGLTLISRSRHAAPPGSAHRMQSKPWSGLRRVLHSRYSGVLLEAAHILTGAPRHAVCRVLRATHRPHVERPSERTPAYRASLEKLDVEGAAAGVVRTPRLHDRKGSRVILRRRVLALGGQHREWHGHESWPCRCVPKGVLVQLRLRQQAVLHCEDDDAANEGRREGRERLHHRRVVRDVPSCIHIRGCSSSAREPCGLPGGRRSTAPLHPLRPTPAALRLPAGCPDPTCCPLAPIRSAPSRTARPALARARGSALETRGHTGGS